MKLRDIFTILLVSLPLIASAADNPTPRDIPREGATCHGSTAAIMNSLPLGIGTPDTDILRIEAIFLSPYNALASGWLYTTRSGKHFVETDSLNTLKGKLGNSDIGKAIDNSKSRNFFGPLSDADMQALRDTNLVFGHCGGTGKGTAPGIIPGTPLP